MTLIRTSMCHFLSTYSVLMICEVMIMIMVGGAACVDYDIGDDGVNYFHDDDVKYDITSHTLTWGSLDLCTCDDDDNDDNDDGDDENG